MNEEHIGNAICHLLPTNVFTNVFVKTSSISVSVLQHPWHGIVDFNPCDRQTRQIVRETISKDSGLQNREFEINGFKYNSNKIK